MFFTANHIQTNIIIFSHIIKLFLKRCDKNHLKLRNTVFILIPRSLTFDKLLSHQYTLHITYTVFRPVSLTVRSLQVCCPAEITEFLTG